MQFHKDTYKILLCKYKLKNVWLNKKDLGVTVAHKLDINQECYAFLKKKVNRSIISNSAEIFAVFGISKVSAGVLVSDFAYSSRGM